MTCAKQLTPAAWNRWSLHLLAKACPATTDTSFLPLASPVHQSWFALTFGTAPSPPPPRTHTSKPVLPPSQGVGVVLFDSSDHALAVVSKLSGTMADGRRLEMALMSPENHMSFTGTRVSAWVCGVCGCV